MKAVHVQFDSARGLLLGTFDDGLTIKSADQYELAERMFAAGAPHGHVGMPDWREGDIAPASGHKIAFQVRLNQLGRTA
ncbi:hypothetical protein ACTJLC_07720 [Paraburkholderia sp. 22099]|uniref:hypothetical protein n=1 Tax=Paraburkholderia sp. 22099 TaxID=3453875 RepID=UPI003F82B9BB